LPVSWPGCSEPGRFKGRRSFELPAWPAAIAVFALAIGLTRFASDVAWHVSLATATLILPAAIVTGQWNMRLWRVPVPGQAGHLRHLGWWGSLGR
jgi:hypothetical protein